MLNEAKATNMSNKEIILEKLKLFSLSDGGIGSWLSGKTDSDVFERLSRIDKKPLTTTQLNQLLAFGHEAPLTDDFFSYYWLTCPKNHPYDVKEIPHYNERWPDCHAIESLEHLSWGFYRLFMDSLIWFGNVRTAYRWLRAQNFSSLEQFYCAKRFDTDLIKRRGLALELSPIAKDDRYLISEMACKSYGDSRQSSGELKNVLLETFRNHAKHDGGPVKIKNLLEGKIPDDLAARQKEFLFSADDVLEETVVTEEEIEVKYEMIAGKFFNARESALKNTRFYLSMVGDLDVYVATSMRNRQDFRNMANICEKIFSSDKLKELGLRYFDPTLSAAAGHEDKGLIECLMVKCAKVLVYCAGERESYGKDAEAAMALSLGKPVIFYCDQEQRSRFYREVHPLSRLIEFETGIAVGAMVTDSIEEVSELLYRIFENKMKYVLEQPKPGYLRLIETLTKSVVRLQTNDEMLRETFWNYYHNG